MAQTISSWPICNHCKSVGDEWPRDSRSSEFITAHGFACCTDCAEIHGLIDPVERYPQRGPVVPFAAVAQAKKRLTRT